MDLETIRQHKEQVILKFAIPSIIAMVLTSMINIVDGFFIGNYVGTEGLAAVNLGLPIVYLYLGLGLMMAVGGISIAGRLLGSGNVKDANQVFRQTVVVCMIVSFALTVIMYFILTPLSHHLVGDEMTREHFVAYYRILIFELPLMVVTSGFGMFIRGEGNPVFVMLTNIISVVLNTILDYIFACLLSKGTAGVAWASLLSAIVVFMINIVYLLKFSKVFHFGQFQFNGGVLKETILNGGSEFIGELSMCISMAAYNFVVLKHAGVDGVAAFTIIGYVSYVFSMIIIGFGQGIVPIISFAYGAEERRLAIGVRNSTFKMVTAAAVVIFAVMSLISSWYCGLFSDSSNVSSMVIPGLRLQMSSFVFAGINTIASFYFTSIGKAKESAVISASRGLIILLIAILVLPMLFGITGVWIVSLLTEAVTLLFSVVYMRQDGMQVISVQTTSAHAIDMQDTNA